MLAMEERTLILIKPGHQGLLAKLNTRLTQKGLELLAVKNVRDLDDIKEKWNDLHSSELDKIDSGPVTALVYQGLDAVNEARISLGDINVKDAFFRSESQGSAEQEIAMWFEEEDMAPAQPVQESESKERQSTVKGWHDLFIKCPLIADHIFSQMKLEEILQLTEVCQDWGQAVQKSEMVQKRLAETKLHKAAIEGWIRVAKLIIARGDSINERVILDGRCYHDNHGLSDHEWDCQCDPCMAINGRALIWAPLHGAVAMGHKDMTHLLLSKGADVNSLLQFWDRLVNTAWAYANQPSRHSVTTLTLVRSCRYDYYQTADSWAPLVAPLVDRQDLDNDYRLIEEALLQHGVNNTKHPETPTQRIVGIYTSLVWAFRDFTKSNDLDHSKEGCLVKKFNLK